MSLSCLLLCWEAFRRLLGLGPLVVFLAVALLTSSSVYHLWVNPWPTMTPRPIELYVFVAEVLLLLLCYLVAVVRGPGFVPKGWAPAEDATLEKRLPARALRPLRGPVSLDDGLQFCVPCGGYKPPRAHHCSTCKRCVPWMDHHCPWTNTCVGHDNMKSFLLFVHYVPVACLHSWFIHTRWLLHLFFDVYYNKTNPTHKLPLSYALQVMICQWRTFFAGTCWGLALVIMFLVGFLAYELDYSTSGNITMVEEGILERALVRRAKGLQPPLSFPYDLGFSQNWRAVLGDWWPVWPLPTLTPGDPLFPQVRAENASDDGGSGEFSLSMEHMAQKALYTSRSIYMWIEKPFQADSLCSCRGCLCCCWTCCKVPIRFGCEVYCHAPDCDQPRLIVRPADQVLVSKQREHWMKGRVVLPPRVEDTCSSFSSSSPAAAQHHRFTNREGWFPSCCVKPGSERANLVPNEKHLAGTWVAEDGREIRAQGVIVYVSAAPEREAPPFILKERWDSSGAFTTLQGCRLLQCDGEVAKWSNGEVWRRPAKEGDQIKRPAASPEDEDEETSSCDDRQEKSDEDGEDEDTDAEVDADAETKKQK